MTQILNVTQNGEGQFEITDQGGKLVEGPFDTKAAAWKALDRLDNQGSNAPAKRRSNKQVLWGQPQKGKSAKKLKRESKIAAQQDKQMKREAHKAVGWVRNIAAVSWILRGTASTGVTSSVLLEPPPK